ncbi:hypothetical protein [Allorhizocola rhizosphaerae]|uniref:hypothetical protein n=1 Tax=Allorhizocola rhizosphaerae TaxID=1872709 RepID=UPI000E3CA45D|nr:hypothetical protein [Allorhizocola rhizosphaerae]
MTYTPAWLRRCDCRCPVHHGYERTTYADDGCACTITCTTQPMTLLAEQWNCALFLDIGGDLWFVNRLPGGQWDWATCDHIHEHHDFYDASIIITRQLRQTAAVLANPTQLRREP